MEQNSLKIVIVDDEECIRESIRMHLSEQGHEVFTATEPTMCDVYCGRPCSKKNPCGDVLMIDQNMRTKKGLDFFKEMQQNGCLGVAANKVVMSGSMNEEEMALAESLGCKFILKPFTLPQVDRFIEEAQNRILSSRTELIS